MACLVCGAEEVALQHVASQRTPENLKVDLPKLVEFNHRDTKVNDCSLHDLMIDRATRQQQFHFIQAEMKKNTASKLAEKAGMVSQRPAKQPTTRRDETANNKNIGQQRQPPQDGCLICKGPYWKKDCPTVTIEQKAEMEKMLREKRERQKVHIKCVVTDDEPTYRTALINGALDVPFCPTLDLPVMAVDPPVEMVAGGGHTMICLEEARLGPQTVTAAGPLALTDGAFLVIQKAHPWTRSARPDDRVHAPHPNSSELFSFATEDGVFTPSRVPQGTSNSAVHFQSQLNEVMKELLFHSVLTTRDFLENLERLFSILRHRMLKLNVRKCKLFERRVKWSDARSCEASSIEAIAVPPTGAALQHFLWALNWLRDSMIDFSRTVAPLREKLEGVMFERGRRKSQLSRATLVWTESERKAFRVTLEMLERSCKLIFPDKGATAHELLICRGGRFKKAQLNWSIVEKEGYPIVKSCGDLDYMFRREKGFRVYCDHSNLIMLFAPDTEAHVKGKVQRWVFDCRYVIHHIAGENNLLADIISRWRQPGVLSNEWQHGLPSESRIYAHDKMNSSGGLLAEIVLAKQQHQVNAPDGATQLDEEIMVVD
ncbi:LOW QUALITY PROTEIN: Hypothetical protein PHPALM_20740 [Phytophthora palmivora]|uniref:Reverse transcriptase RNase H-like domain-containing protein n=1 Tax=Phytophthora palmivora TaxID=4796 RepID=A0A2P4XE30_9STRA|nr:LOW QUALITY PROTEIN: Hypothetical protein PHPALM_20740 [Phytophthora palmivora]